MQNSVVIGVQELSGVVGRYIRWLSIRRVSEKLYTLGPEQNSQSRNFTTIDCLVSAYLCTDGGYMDGIYIDQDVAMHSAFLAVHSGCASL